MIYKVFLHHGQVEITDEVGAWSALHWPNHEVIITPWSSKHLHPAEGKKPCTSMDHYQIREVRDNSNPKMILSTIVRAHTAKTINAIPNPYHHVTETIQTTVGGRDPSSSKPKLRTKPRASHRVGKKRSNTKRGRNLQ